MADVSSRITLGDRLEHGYLTVDELCALKQCGKSQIYDDIKSGALIVEKHGRATRIAGPVAKEYRPGSRRRSTSHSEAA